MRRLALLGLAVAVVGCGKDPVVVPVRNLERPADMTFLCMRQVQTANGLRLTGRPMTDCRPHLDSSLKVPDPPVDANARPRQFGTFGLVTQTARGELGVIDIDANRLVDLDPTEPGFNMLPIGTFPEVMAASQDGCMVATANRGSCDLTVVDPQRLLAGAFGEATVASTATGGKDAITSRVVPTTPSGRKLLVAPQEIAFLPQPTANLDVFVPESQRALTNPEAMCQSATAYNRASPDRAPWRAVVTFPSCDLVAVVELPTGTIVSSVYVRSTGVIDAGSEPVCTPECGMGVPPPAPDAAVSPDAAMSVPPDAAAVVPPPAPDAAASADAVTDAPPAADAGVAGDGPQADRPPADAGQPRIPGAPARTGALVIRPEGNRLYVGGGNDVYITALDIVDGKLEAASRIPLHDGAGGVRRLRLSLDPNVVFGGKVGRFMGGTEEKQYLYAFAADDSVRVVDVNPKSGRNTFEFECDVNIDPQFIPTTDPQYIAGTVPDCYALFDDPAHPPAPRRAFARGPGLRIPDLGNAGRAPPVPQDIAFSSQRSGTGSTSGDFGFMVATDGQVYVLNVDSLLGGVNPPDNSYRDYNAGPLGTPGGPQVQVTPARNFSVSDIPLPTRVPLGNLQGPRIEGLVQNDATKEVKWVTFPDPRAASSQTWQLTWEGPLTSSTRTHGAVFPPTAERQGGAVIDQGQEFCQQGVLPGDVVLLNGCSRDLDCATDGTLVCRQALPGTPGLCFPVAQAKDTDLLGVCSRHLTSRRRYEVAVSTPRRLELALKPDELPKTSLDRCQTDDDCRRGPAGVAFEGFSCLQVYKDEPKRCVKSCAAANGDPNGDDKLCRTGTVCEQIAGSITGPLCVEGPPIKPECWPVGAGYQVQSAQSFLVFGSLAPRPFTARVEDLPGDPRPASERRCVPDDARNPLLVNRIPIDAPHCTNVVDADVDINNARNAFKGTVPAGPPGTWGNPCLFWGVNDDDACVRRQLAGGPYVPNPDPALGCSCTPDANGQRPAGCHVKALFQNPEVRFVVTNLEQFAGDANITRFDVLGGFAPEQVSRRDDILVTMGVRVVTGPIMTPESPRSSMTTDPTAPFFPYLFLLDQGRTGSSAAGRGQVLRINPRYGVYGLPQFDSNYSPYPFQIQ